MFSILFQGIYEYWAETIEQITWTNVLQNRCYMCIQWTWDMYTLFRLSSGPFFSCFSYFSYFFLKKPYYPCFFKSSKRNLPHMALCREDVYDIFLWGPTYGFKNYMPLVRTYFYMYLNIENVCSTCFILSELNVPHMNSLKCRCARHNLCEARPKGFRVMNLCEILTNPQ